MSSRRRTLSPVHASLLLGLVAALVGCGDAPAPPPAAPEPEPAEEGEGEGDGEWEDE